jgi:hypothetical protein
MLLGSARQRLTRDDAQLVVRMLESEGAHQPDLESSLADQGLDALLDDPRLPSALLRQTRGARASLPLFTYVLVRRTLLDVQESERPIADYVASILLHFGLQGRAYRIREHDDVTYDSLVALAADAECSDPSRAFLVRAHMGSFALWLAGVFPDFIVARHHRRGGPDLGYFDEMGRRGYLMAAQHRFAEQHGVAELFVMLSERFPKLRFALNRISDQMFFRDRSSADKLLRQVQDEARWGVT